VIKSMQLRAQLSSELSGNMGYLHVKDNISNQDDRKSSTSLIQNKCCEMLTRQLGSKLHMPPQHRTLLGIQA
jgi:hypothetical protein